jgi:quinol monooxygenase YgiN
VTEKMMLELSTQPEKRAEFVEMCQGILPDTRAYDGNQATRLWIPEDNDSIVWIDEEWESRAHQEVYFAWRVETGLVDAVSAFLLGPPRIIWLAEQ